MNLRDKIIVITGGSQGIGFAIATELAEHGASIAIIDIAEERLNNAVNELTTNGHTAKGFVANVAKENDVIHAFAKIKDCFGNIDGLVNNAGITKDALLLKADNNKIVKRMSLAQWQAVIDVNLTGVFLCGREAASIMVEQEKEGVIVNISSISRAGNYGQSNYSAAKSGVASMTTVWAKELAKYNIRVAAVAPGVIETDMISAMKPEARERFASNIPLNRLGQPKNIAHAVRFIFENDFISGRVIDVDGAMRL